MQCVIESLNIDVSYCHSNQISKEKTRTPKYRNRENILELSIVVLVGGWVGGWMDVSSLSCYAVRSVLSSLQSSRCG